MSSGIRSTEKRSKGSAGLRAMGSRPGQGGLFAQRRPQPQRRAPPPGTANAAAAAAAAALRHRSDQDIPLAAATGLAPPSSSAKPQPSQHQPQQPPRSSVEYTLVSAQLPRTHNVMRMLSAKPVDFAEFTAPVKLRRRNKEYYRLKNKKRNEERAALLEQEMQKNKAEGVEVVQREERPKADINLIADVGGARSNKKNLFKKRTKQVYFADEEKRRLDIEEARPWVLEDDDEKEVWTGSLEGGQMSTYVLFVLTEDGFKVVPVNRWYKFAPKLKYKTLTLDEAEEEMKRARKVDAHDRWIMRKRMLALDDNPDKDKPDEKPTGARSVRPSLSSFGGSGGSSSLVEYEVDDDIFADDDDDDDGRRRAAKKASGPGKHGGVDEYEYEAVFDDDEELGDVLFEYNEEEVNEKKQQQLKNTKATGYDSEEGEDFGDDYRVADEKEKSMRNLIKKLDDNKDAVYESEEEENPYWSVSEVDSDEEEQQDPNKPKGEQESAEKGAAADSSGASPAAASSPSVKDTAASSPGSAAASAKPGVGAGAASPTDSTSAAKKRKRPMVAPTGSSSASASASASAGDVRKQARPSVASSPPLSSAAATGAGGGSSDIITKQEIIDLIKSGVNTTKELIGCVRKKLRANPENKNRIQAIVKEVAILKSGHLTLKKL
ncbi:transcription factor IIF subunit tfg1 [Coemansia sp. Benny D115]|nr:transcription factor IIF subunit tfg1 [Coemansia sp. Benny D115]